MSQANKKRPVHASARPIACGKARDATNLVMSELETATRDHVFQRDRIVEQLKQCPEAFQVGEMLAKILDAKRHDPNQTERDGCLPPAGTVVPPLV
jgi:hypothetical protein